MTANIPFRAIIPAAGIGSRMGSVIPKQYLKLRGHAVLTHTLERFLEHPACCGVVVAISASDSWWGELALDHPALTVVEGGTERCHSVLNALDSLTGQAGEGDWVLVHDAVRPCLRREDIDRLLLTLGGHEVGGLLGIPVSDTVKRSDASGHILATIDRAHLWRAATPQMFRVGTLRRALREALGNGLIVTDEAAAMEHIGLRPCMVKGHADNIKITRPEDRALAELYLEQQGI